MNPYNRIHLGNQEYTCCICKVVNPLPVNYIRGKDNVPQEMTLEYSSFVIGKAEVVPAKEMGLLFMVDLAVDGKEL